MEFANKRIYLSGPMTGMHDWNRETFIEAARYLRNQGARVFNPAFNASSNKLDTHQVCMLRDLHELTEHIDGKPFYDILAQLPGWEKSKGANVELIVAKACGIDVITV